MRYDARVNAPQPHAYNAESRIIEPITESDVGLYVCGVTPYDTSHLGHAFTYTVFDVFIRYLRFLGRKVTYVQNVTDIDDDVLMRAHKTGRDWKELGDSEYARFCECMRALGNLDPDVAPRATDHIPEMQNIVQGLIDRGFAYESGGSVYFEVAKDPKFGRLFGHSYDSMLQIANERGNFPADPLKRDPLDFVLWQAQKPGEPSWDSPWGPGRPGWHIECSAMAMKYLGETVTVHGGGEDLVFPHHDAEIAQSENYTGAPFVRHWMHAAMVYCGEHKMSKSLGNMVFVADLLKEVSVDALRLYLLSHHYRKAWDHPMDATVPTGALAARLAAALADAGDASDDEVERYGAPLLEAMADDLDTPRAISELERLAGSEEPGARRAARALATNVLGLSLVQ
jgi:L-cysteine:1D-myo-inositol 2-amino-2-deoxy-alpha-D-glucopyranoside ligase